MLEEMKKELAAQQRLLAQCRAEIEILPKGSLTVRAGSRRNYYCHSVCQEGKRQVRYLSPAKPEGRMLIECLQRRALLEDTACVLEGNVRVLSKCVEKYRPVNPAGYGLPAEDWTMWGDAAYQQSTVNPEGLKISSIGGLLVRSKSEALIAFALDLAGIPFHYEEVLRHGETKMAPDFTLRHPISGSRFYWEHFGMMDDEEYAADAFRKLQRYASMGIFPGKQLILTMENKDCPLGLAEIRRMIDLYFLR